VLDRRASNCAAADALRVKPGIEAFVRKIGLQPLREQGSVFARIGNEDAGWFGHIG